MFDVEGVIIPKRLALIAEIIRQQSPIKIIILLVFAALYQVNILPLKSFISRSYKLLKGTDIKTFHLVYNLTPISRNSGTVFNSLRDLGYSTVLMSSGLPQEIVDDLKQRLGADLAYGINVEKDEQGYLTGEIKGTVIEKNGKLLLCGPSFIG